VGVIKRVSIAILATFVALAAAACGAGSRAHHAAGAPVAWHGPALAAPQSHQAAVKRAAELAVTASCGRGGPPERQIGRRQWLSGFIITEYYPVPERWFNGASASAPGKSGRHRVDWLYSASGVSMEGDGVDLHGHHVHIADLGSVGWVNSAGRPTVPPHCGIRWSHGPPAWRAGGWRNRTGAVTYPLSGRAGWSNGFGHWIGSYGGATFEPGSSLPLRYYHSVAVDTNLIPRGSRIYIPAYRDVNGGWFVAQDTGGAIIGRHIDVYRPPTAQPFGSGRLFLNIRAYVIPPGA
jgi:3D (Asp-Asp-Asp) domain-containing protein